MNTTGRTFILQQPQIQSARKAPSVTPTKVQNMGSMTKFNDDQYRIRVRSRERQQQGTPQQSQRNKDGSQVIYNLLSTSRPASNLQHLAKKQSLNDSSERRRRASPLDRLNKFQQDSSGHRISSIHKSRQVSVSQSQLALNQVLAQMQLTHTTESDHYGPLFQQQQRKQTYNNHAAELSSSQKSNLNSHVLTTSSSNKPQRLSSVSFEEYSKIVKEFTNQQKLIKFLRQKISILESINSKILQITKQCDDCTQNLELELSDFINNVQNIELNQYYMDDQQLQKTQNNLLNQQDSLENLMKPRENEKMEAFKIEEYSNTQIPHMITSFYAQQMNSIAEDFFEQYRKLEEDSSFFKSTIQNVVY